MAAYNPNDIESDRAQGRRSKTAIYGSAHNGVIVIITKKGGDSAQPHHQYRLGSDQDGQP